MTRPRWFDQAICKGHTHLFFPHYNERPSARRKREQKAIEICNSCPVQQPCQQYARDNHEYGVWGAENEEQRFEAGYSPLNVSKKKRT